MTNTDLQFIKFVGSLSHDLRSPLTAIIGYADLLFQLVAETTGLPSNGLADGLADRDDLLYYITTISKSGHCLLASINNLTTLARIETGEIVLFPHRTDLAELTSRLLSKGCYQEGRDGLEPTSTNLIAQKPTERTLPHIMVDPFRLEQVISNLIGYVRGNEGENGVIINAWVGQGKSKRTVISVSTNKKRGLDLTTLPYIWDVYHKPPMTSPSIKLGLTVAKRLSLLMGGELTAIGTESGKMTFILTLPLAGTPVEKRPAATKTAA